MDFKAFFRKNKWKEVALSGRNQIKEICQSQRLDKRIVSRKIRVYKKGKDPVCPCFWLGFKNYCGNRIKRKPYLFNFRLIHLDFAGFNEQLFSNG
ncbi:hypothetical protein AHMF7605_23710 [Adhaeribacter arboris]|uniref:Uncharacterized protein n=1 Tax=Adhaeribacter arboris TaxID=2072846 RepID=A0A2T2YLC0_9BACT|nr:hypothetical protein AHMF7605_23710 [Adhaeribacter arboris]